ncbi:hypothetical protein A3Q56_01904 [Intoshia linei]|uniref:Uncharacterized protein n=1 Tax=Intoshia linei TaxID=1819745 RepID=A0A177B7R1_9BILA|nr:hypothetical protein A3Q56_01904 [Intoshia linei]
MDKLKFETESERDEAEKDVNKSTIEEILSNSDKNIFAFPELNTVINTKNLLNTLKDDLISENDIVRNIEQNKNLQGELNMQASSKINKEKFDSVYTSLPDIHTPKKFLKFKNKEYFDNQIELSIDYEYPSMEGIINMDYTDIINSYKFPFSYNEKSKIDQDLLFLYNKEIDKEYQLFDSNMAVD